MKRINSIGWACLAIFALIALTKFSPSFEAALGVPPREAYLVIAVSAFFFGYFGINKRTK